MVISLHSVLLFFGIIFHSDSLSKEVFVPAYSILKERVTYTVKEDFGYTIHTEKHLQIIDEEGFRHAFTSLFYDKFVEIKDFQLEVIDPTTGKTLEKARLRDMSDISIISNTSVFEDNRNKFYQVKTRKFPVEIKIHTESYHKTNYYFPRWIPVHYLYQKVEKSVLEVIYPKTLGIRYKELNLLGKRQEEDLPNNYSKLTWVESNLPLQGSDFETGNEHQVLIAPREFSMEGYNGTMDDWSGFAAWQYEINKGRRELPDYFKQQVLQMVDGVDDQYQKVSILYNYLQKNYRYVSIQLGIGGWQSMTAEEVIRYSYGDCKALTNLMKSMLEVVGIPSYYTLVRAGNDTGEIQVDFPSNQFNHVILQVPTETNPIWLECTSNVLPAGYLGDFTKGRNVLVIQEDGGYITKTPTYSAIGWNEIRSWNHIEMDIQGNATIKSIRDLKGNFAEEMLMLQSYRDSREQRDFFNKNFPISGLIIEDIQLNVDKIDSIPVSRLELQGHILKFAQPTSKKMILKPFFEKISEQMVNNMGLDLNETYLITWPEGVFPDIESLDFQEENPDYTIKISHEFHEGSLEVNRIVKLSIKEGIDATSKAQIVKNVNQTAQKSYYFNKSSQLFN